MAPVFARLSFMWCALVWVGAFRTRGALSSKSTYGKNTNLRAASRPAPRYCPYRTSIWLRFFCGNYVDFLTFFTFCCLLRLRSVDCFGSFFQNPLVFSTFCHSFFRFFDVFDIFRFIEIQIRRFCLAPFFKNVSFFQPFVICQIRTFSL